MTRQSIERTAAMERAYLDGASMAEVGARFGVSKQRVEQLLRPALDAGRIPRALRRERHAEASVRRALSPEVQEGLSQGQSERWGQQGYSAAFKRVVADAARRNGVLPTSRAWGVTENTVRRWRDELPSGAPSPENSRL